MPPPPPSSTRRRPVRSLLSQKPAPARGRVGASSPTPDAPRVSRPLRWLRRLLIAAVLLGGLGLGALTWFAYWPLEGKVDRVEGLVPADVDFMYRTSWTELKATGSIQRSLFDQPIHPGLDANKMIVDPVRGTTFARSLDQIKDTEDQIAAQLPGAVRTLQGIFFGSKEFRVEKDLFPAEVVAAGRWCSGGNPSDGPPQWRELLLLTRVTPVVKFAFEAARHDFVRERLGLGPDVEITATPEGMLRIDRLRYREPAKPMTCEGGAIMGSLKVWYAARVKDVLVISNSEDFARLAVDTEKAGGDRAIDRPAFDVERPEGGIAASLDLIGLRSYLERFFSSTGSDSKTVGRFFSKFVAIDSLDRLSAVLRPSGDGLEASAEISYQAEIMRRHRDAAATYELPPGPIASGIARLVPEQDTVFLAQVKTPAGSLLHALYDSLPPEDQRLVESNLRELSARRRADGKVGYANMGEFLDELGEQLGNDTGVVIARMSKVFNDGMFADWFSGSDPHPSAILTVMCRIREGATQEQVNEFLSDRVAALGFKPPELVTSPDGLEYSRLRLPARTKDTELIEPAFKVYQGQLILSSREDHLLEVLRTMRGDVRALADSAAFQEAMAPLPKDATVAIYANGDNLRALAWDFRNDWVHRNHDDVRHLAEYRSKLHTEAGRVTDLGAINDKVDAEAERFRRDEYPVFVREYRKKIDDLARFRGFAFVLAADRADAKLRGGVSLRFHPAPGR